MNLLLIFLAVLPIILIAKYFYKKDTLKESKKLLQKLFFGGFLSTILVIVISIIIMIIIPEFANIENASLLKIFVYSFIFVALVEEFSKWITIYKVSYNDKEFDQLYDIVLYSVIVGLGFACLENILYVLQEGSGLIIAIFRAITAVPAHACFQTFMGYYLSLSKFDNKENKNKYLTLSILVPVLLHGTYDFLLLSQNIILVCIYLLFVVLMFIFAILRIEKIVKSDSDNLKRNICPNCNIIIEYNFCPNCGYKK